MEGPVLTESEVWKVGSGTSAIDFSPLMNAESESKISVQEEICANIEEPEVSPDQVKSEIPHEMRLEEDLSEVRCVNQAENKTSLISNQQDVEITILVTNHDCTLEDDGNEDFEEQKTCHAESESVSSTDGQKTIEEESQDGSIVVANVIEVSQVQKANVSTEQNTNVEEPESPGGQSREDKNKDERDSKRASNTDASSTCVNTNTEPRVSIEVSGVKDQSNQPEGEEINIKLEKTESGECEDAGRPPQETLALTRSPGRHVQTQVSLEVMYHSVATSPMTPPEGSATFVFPSSFGKLGSRCTTEAAQTSDTKDAELQVGVEVEFRSVATAPMTPIILTAPEVIPEPEPRIGVKPEDLPEPVQEVSWDEKGMTWEVYGAVVEVAVLGTAIQKHLEKKQKKLSTLPVPTDAPQTDTTETSVPVPSSPPPTSDPSESNPVIEPSTKTEEKEENGGRRRRNPFRRWFRNVRRPSCCSRPRQDEDN